MTLPLLRPALILTGLALAGVPASAQSRDRRDSGSSRPRREPTPPPEPVFPNIYIVKPSPAVETVQAPSPLAAIWDRLGVGSATSIDVNQNPALRSSLQRLGVQVPRDGILRKPTSAADTSDADAVIVLARTGTVITVTGGATTAGTDSNSAPSARPAVASAYPSYPSYPSDPSFLPPGTLGVAADPTAQGPASEDGDGDGEEGVVRHDSLPADAPGFWAGLDKDRDAQISLYEWRTGGKNVEEFAARDLNSDGYLVLDEYTRSLESLPASPAAPGRRFGR